MSGPQATLVFPAIDHSYSVHFKPTFAPVVWTTVSGKTYRALKQAFPLWEFELTFERLADSYSGYSTEAVVPRYALDDELRRVQGLFLACKGQQTPFLYSCPEDFSRDAGQVATGDGTNKNFVVWRYYGPWGYREPVGAINYISAVYFNGIEVDPRTYNFTGNVLTFASPPVDGFEITADFTFYYVCRFIEDVTDYSQFLHNLWELKVCRFRTFKA